MGVVADSFDQLADCFVYGIVLASLARPAASRRRAARFGGMVQAALALSGFAEVVRRAVSGADPPDFAVMMLMSCVALFGNGASYFLLTKARGGGIGLRASVVFSIIDLWANGLMMAATALVHFSASPVPDLIAATLVLSMVLAGAAEIFKMR
jgi:Co/Zn/Cd efflux system component